MKKNITFHKQDENYIPNPARGWKIILLIFIVSLMVFAGIAGSMFFALSNTNSEANTDVVLDSGKLVNINGLSKVLKYFDDKKTNFQAISNGSQKELDPSL